MPKTAKNLYLDARLVERAEAFGRAHGTDLSNLVTDFLRLLEARASAEHGPVVQRLVGAGVARDAKRVGKGADAQDYKRYLVGKYGGKHVAEGRPKRNKKR
jgi:Family of unknown function (DUF6364)